MHVEKIIYNILLEVVLDIRGRRKGTLNGSSELMQWRLGKRFIIYLRVTTLYKLPPTCYWIQVRDIVLLTCGNVLGFPNGYAFNISQGLLLRTIGSLG